MLEIDAKLREAGETALRPVILQAFADGELHVEGAGRSLQLRARALRLGARAPDGSRALHLDDGATIAIAANDAFERWIQRQRGGGEGLWGARARRLARGAASLAATALAVFAIVRVAVPGLAGLVARAAPYAADVKIGAGVHDALDGQLAASALPAARRAEIGAIFERTASYAHLTHPARLELRGGGELGANAFALPGGTVVVTDELAALAKSDDELAGVIAHELGHLEHRHGLRALLQAVGVGALASGALGDFEGVLAGAGPLLLQLQYSRGFEREADNFARRTLAEADADPRALGRMLVRLEAANASGGLPAYLSTHPATEERRRALEE